MTLRRVVASGTAALALVAGISVGAAGTASAAQTGGGCVYHDKDGFSVRTCIDGDGAGGIWADVQTYGSNNTSINMCVEIVDSNQNLVPGSRNCQIVNGSSSDTGTNIVFPGSGTYYGVSYFTSPTYWYGGESPSISI
ncbi:hypothetical protein ABH931_005065 [Streptacidiphilus sp. MAP12-33]|uniref:hypothetical protein n=1 Tax=Streptacidiphilus sp. MAP12-33 TaxID=3156266 RepID=UPI003514A2C0